MAASGRLGYDKLPPLPWFLAEIALSRVRRRRLALRAVAGRGHRRVRRRVDDGAAAGRRIGALAAVLIIDGMNYFNTSATKFNHNVVELPLWALAGFAFYAALRGGKLRFWILLGVALGLAWWAKYFMVILAAPLALFLLFDPQARRRLAGPGPWIAAAVTLVVVAPNLLWLFQHGDAAVRIRRRRAPRRRRPARSSAAIRLEFLGAQAIFLIPALLIAAAAILAAGEAGAARECRRIRPPHHFASGLWSGAALFVFSAVSGRATQAMWGFPLWLFLGPADRRLFVPRRA